PGAGAGVPEGLSSFGREVVRRMNALGIVVDLSHAGERAFHEALETSTVPVIASHSGCRALHDHPRNLSDTQLRALAQQGGVIGIVFHPPFLDAAAKAEQERVRKLPEYAGIEASEPMARFLAQQRVMRAHAAPFPLARLVAHVEHAVEVAGIAHVGLGSDFDGIERGPEGLEDARGYATLAEALARRGYSDEDLLALLGGNMERVFRAATAPGAR
ncbi:MAG TPA: membrane dipeptidase, partial [Planctomycetota bacterium]